MLIGAVTSPTSVTIAMQQDAESPNLNQSSTDPLSLLKYKVGAAALFALKQSSKPAIFDFYKHQDGLIDLLLSDPCSRDDQEDSRQWRLKVAVVGSVIANVFLLGLQLLAAILSKSLALFATTADAFMDLASAVVLMIAQHYAAQENDLLYPTGKARYETAGIIVFATLMATLSIQIVVTSIQGFLAGQADIEFGTIAISCVTIAIGTKFILYMYCSALSQYSSARILAQDHRNDILVNSTGIVFGLIAKYYAWWVDPIGAILIAMIILRSWTLTGQEHIQLLAGKAADKDVITRLTYIAMTHDPRITQIDTCRAYHNGNNFFVEVDIVLPPTMRLSEAHDIGESLQICFESLQNVDRAFVHLDYETDHKPEHKKSI